MKNKIPINRHLRLWLPLLLTLLLPTLIAAQEFSVASFRDLPNDVSAFINPVRDLNDEDCALLKVVAPADFVFSTPLGIVKRVDHPGEIWLYLPRGSRKITLKHAEWGVLRDYEFPARLESHKAYEMALSYPQSSLSVLSHGGPTTITIRDTLIVTHTDTLLIKPVKHRIPLEFNILANYGFGGRGRYSFATLMLTLMRRHGGYIRISMLPGAAEDPVAACDRHGLIDGRQRFYSGAIARKVLMVTGGPIHSLSSRFNIFEGIGYADNRLDWQLAPSEGGGYVTNSYFSHKGLTVEAGLQFRCNRIVLSASVMTVRGSEWFASIGAGFRFGKGVKK